VQSDDENELTSDQLAQDLAVEDTEDARPTKRRRLMPISQDDWWVCLLWHQME